MIFGEFQMKYHIVHNTVNIIKSCVSLDKVTNPLGLSYLPTEWEYNSTYLIGYL